MENAGAFAAYDWSNESFISLDRPELDDRFFIYDQRVSMGLQQDIAAAALVGVGLWAVSSSTGICSKGRHLLLHE